MNIEMKKFFYILSAAAVLMMAACTQELVPDQSVQNVDFPEGAMACVTFSISVPEATLSAIPTRGLMDDQPTISKDEIFVAVFGEGTNATNGKGGHLLHFLKARLKNQDSIVHNVGDDNTTTPANYKYEYEVLLPLSNDPLILDFLVGACDSEGRPYDLDNPLPASLNGKDMYEDDDLKLLFCGGGNAAYSQRIRIDGVFPKPKTGGGYEMTTYTDPDDPNALLPIADQDYIADEIEELKNVQLIRNFAKITYSASGDAPFTLDGFFLVDTPVQGTVVPFSGTTGYTTPYMTATTPDEILNSGYRGYVREEDKQLASFTEEEIEEKEFFETGDYEFMYERSIPTQSTPVYAESGAIVKVTWDLDKVTDSDLKTLLTANPERYYKVSFVDSKGYVPILRNIVYNFSIKDITADVHPTTAWEAYQGEFLGDVSASISTSMLDEITNHKSRIWVRPMSFTSIGAGKTATVDFRFYPVDGKSEVVVTNDKRSTEANAPVIIRTELLNESGYTQAITDVSDVVVTPKTDGSDDYGTISVTLADSEDGVVKKGVVRILGEVAGMRPMYRDVVFTVMSKQDFAYDVTSTNASGDQVTEKMWSSVSALSVDNMGEEVAVTIRLPEALPRDIFPLQIAIEAQNNCLTSISKGNVSALPVKAGKSAFPNADESQNKNTYFFVKTITFDDYAKLKGMTYEYTKEFQCYFKTRLDAGKNATTIAIRNIETNDSGNLEYNTIFNMKTLGLSLGISVSPTPQTVNYTTTSATFTLTSSYAWRLTGTDGLTVATGTPTSGDAGTQDLTFTFDPNDSNAPKTLTATFSATTDEGQILTATATVIQNRPSQQVTRTINTTSGTFNTQYIYTGQYASELGISFTNAYRRYNNYIDLNNNSSMTISADTITSIVIIWYGNNYVPNRTTVTAGEGSVTTNGTTTTWTNTSGANSVTLSFGGGNNSSSFDIVSVDVTYLVE